VQVESVAHASLAHQGIQAERVLTVPAPFNTLLWRVLAMAEDGYYEGFYSLLDEGPEVAFSRYPSDPGLLRGLETHWPVQRLQWFTHGFNSVTLHGRDIVITDLRMGVEPDYIFRFKVAEQGNPHPLPTAAEQLADERNYGRLRWVWQRIWSEEPLYPSAAAS
jgi:inner membrane protein